MNELYAHAPHRRPGAEETSSNAALLIDFDNVTMGTRSNLGQELRKLLNSDIIKGKVAVQRAYADWRRYPQYIVSLSEASIDLIFAPAYGSSKKNATDIRLAIDALELVFIRPEIGTYILLSGDSDFSSLVLKLKEYGKYVIGVGMQESSSDLLVQNCDEYYSYNSISGLTSAEDAPREKHDPWVLASRAILKMEERKDVMRSDRFKQVMLELDQQFDEKEIGYSKFNRFLTEAASKGILSLEKAANGQYEVAAGSRAKAIAAGDDVPAAPSASPGSSSSSEKRPRSRSRSRRSQERKPSRREAPPAEQEAPTVDEDRLRSAYNLLSGVTADLARTGSPVRDSEVKRRMLDKDGQFDEAALGFSKFSRFLRQAHDEGIVDLERGPEGNYLVSPAEAKAPEERPAPSRQGRSDRGRATERGREPKRDTEPEVKAEAAIEAKAEAATEDRKVVEAAPESPPSAAGSSDSSPSNHEAGTGRPAGLGRFRRGSRSRSAPAASRKTAVPGPVDAEPQEVETGTKTEAKQQASAGSVPAGSPPVTSGEATGKGGQSAEQPRRSVSGRQRRRGRGGQARAAAKQPDSSVAKPSGSGSASASETSQFQAQIEAMSRNYPGVGRRTADVLFREFGEGVYTVIDEQPEKIRAVLPEHRA
ncbi:MAG: NYN domain-containing protein, partial [Gemmatimonadota bacterium]